MLMNISGRTSASSQASRALSTASLMVVMMPRVGESKPSRCLFFSKNSATLMLRCCLARSSASTMSCHPGDGVRKALFLLLPGVEVLEGHRARFDLALPEDNGNVCGLCGVGDLGAHPPLHQVDLGPDPGIPEGSGDFECPYPCLGRADDADNGLMRKIEVPDRDHHPVKPDGKPAGS